MKDETIWILHFTAEMQYKHIDIWKIEDFITKKSDTNLKCRTVQMLRKFGFIPFCE